MVPSSIPLSSLALPSVTVSPLLASRSAVPLTLCLLTITTPREVNLSLCSTDRVTITVLTHWNCTAGLDEASHFVWTDLLETDFFHLDNISKDTDWQVQNYSVTAQESRGPLGYVFSRDRPDNMPSKFALSCKDSHTDKFKDQLRSERCYPQSYPRRK